METAMLQIIDKFDKLQGFVTLSTIVMLIFFAWCCAVCFKYFHMEPIERDGVDGWSKFFGPLAPLLINALTAFLYPAILAVGVSVFICNTFQRDVDEYCVMAIKADKNIELVTLFKEMETDPYLEVVYGKFSRITESCKNGTAIKLIYGE